ncbi:(2Fe-2S)-binding protein [SAR202 cluster bacterium AD-802-E10_MRT_200m]|nr:(2Fe-2S)-binding protein [SAR202 cluster bacterium AD-802-E10_MRT_200m]
MLSTNALYPIKFKVNGTNYQMEVPPQRTLIDLLRYDLNLTGTKEACGVGVCGACTILVNSKNVASCIMLAVQADGTEITTIEGISQDENLHPLQESFMKNGGFQCGICTSGQIVSATALLHEIPSPTQNQVKEWMMGNLCRCTGYYQIIESILKANKGQN